MFASVRLSLSFLTGKQRVQYYALVGLRALTGLFDVVGIALIGFIAGVGSSQLSSSGTSAPTQILGITLPAVTSEGLVWLVVFVLVVFIVKASTAVFLIRRLTTLIAGVEGENSRQIADYVLRGSLDQVKKYSKAEVQYSVTVSTTYAFTGLLNNIAVFIGEGFLLIVVSATFIAVNPLAALFALVYFSLIIVVIQVFIGGNLKRAGQEAVAGTVLTNAAVSDTMDSYREISVLAKQDLFIERIFQSRMRIARSGATMTFLGGMPRYVVETALILGVVVFVAQQFLTGQLSSGIVTIGVFLTGGVRIMASLLPLQTAIGSMKQNVEQASPSQVILGEIREAKRNAPAEVAVDRAQLDAIARNHGLPVHIDDVRFRYPGDLHDTLHGVSLDIAAGTQVAIIGPSGAGKTTLVDMILGLLHPESGEVRIGGVEPNDLRRIAPGKISYVPQKPGLVSGTIADNVALGVRPEEIDRERVAEVLAAAYLTDFIETLPDGIDTSVGKQVDSLSGGQIQRIGLARALYSAPQLLILDEATSGLDAGSEAFVSESLRKLHGEVTIIIIAHRLSTVQHSDLVHVVEDGRITASDSFKKLQSTVPMVAEYVRLMSFDDD